MTPQEQALVDELFDRLASVENAARDPEAERVIANGLRRAPHAVYALVQTALVQDEALKRATARMEELQAQLDGAPQVQQQGSFLDSMREAVLGRREPRGSVPSVRSPSTQSSPNAPPPYEGGFDYPTQMPTGTAFGSGGSFLGTAASTAAGVIGGALLMDGIRSMFGHHGSGAAAQSAFGPLAGSGSASGSALAREAGVDDIDRGAASDRQRAADAAADRQQDWEEDRQSAADAAADRQQDWEEDRQSAADQQQDWEDDLADDDSNFEGDGGDFA
jgi:hypothetical protein